METELTCLLQGDVATTLRGIEQLMREVDAAAEEGQGGDSLAATIAAKKIMIVSPDLATSGVVREVLAAEGFERFTTTLEPERVLRLMRLETPDVVLLDVPTCAEGGTDLIADIRTETAFAQTPLLLFTEPHDRGLRQRAIGEGVTDFLTRPADATEIIPRVRNALLVKIHRDDLDTHLHQWENALERRTGQLNKVQADLIHCLARAAEFRDNETGRHVIRVARYAGLIAREIGLPNQMCELIELAAPLHDIGKIGVPDAILLKPDKLAHEELQMMQRHCGFGKKIVEPMTTDEQNSLRRHTDVGASILFSTRSPVMRVAARIALTHHERWDGAGYPLGLAGEEIPLEGRIVAVADVFDALSSQRPYKPAFPIERCFEILREGRGTQFDPGVLDAFFAREEEIVQVRIRYADTH